MVDRCPHRAAALSEGLLTPDGLIQCAYHGRPISTIFPIQVSTAMSTFAVLPFPVRLPQCADLTSGNISIRMDLFSDNWKEWRLEAFIPGNQRLQLGRAACSGAGFRLGGDIRRRVAT